MSSLPQNSSKQLNAYLVAAIMVVVYAGVNYICLGKLQLCVWRSAIGFPCPGCGLTHAGLFLLSGNIRESLIWHPFLIPIVGTVAIYCIPDGKWRLADWFRRQMWWVILLNVVVMVHFVWRVIVYYPQGMDEGPMYFDPHNYCSRLFILAEKLIELIAS